MELNCSQISRIESAIRNHCATRSDAGDPEKCVGMFHRLRTDGGARISQKFANRYGALQDLGIVTWRKGTLSLHPPGIRNLL